MKLEEEVRRKLRLHPGISNEAILSELARSRDLKWIADDLLKGRVSFAMNASPRSRRGILEKGFQNQYQTGFSSAELDSAWREWSEAYYAGMSVKDYRSIPISCRPKYGYLAPPLGHRLRRSERAKDYGSDTYYFKKERLRNYTTWFPGDSLVHSQFLKEYPGAAIWARRFIPWSLRSLLLLHLKASESGESPSELALQDLGYGSIVLDSGLEVPRLISIEEDIIELQFWKSGDDFDLDDVEGFAFSERPPRGRFLAALKARKIEIYYKAEGGDRLWRGPEKSPN